MRGKKIAPDFFATIFGRRGFNPHDRTGVFEKRICNEDGQTFFITLGNLDGTWTKTFEVLGDSLTEVQNL